MSCRLTSINLDQIGAPHAVNRKKIVVVSEMNNTFSNLFLTFIATVFTGILLFVVAKFVLIGLSHTITLLVATL